MWQLNISDVPLEATAALKEGDVLSEEVSTLGTESLPSAESEIQLREESPVSPCESSRVSVPEDILEQAKITDVESDVGVEALDTQGAKLLEISGELLIWGSLSPTRNNAG